MKGEQAGVKKGEGEKVWVRRDSGVTWMKGKGKIDR